MDRTWRFWTEAGVAAVLALLAAGTDRPFLLLGATGVAAFLVARQYAFVGSLSHALGGLDVSYTLPERAATVGEPVPIAVEVRAPPRTDCDLTIEVVPPATAVLVEGDARVQLDAGETSATADLSVEWSVAGSFQFEPARISAVDPYGIVRETVDGEPGPRVRVDSRGAAAGRSSGRRSGVDPVGVGESVADDALRRVDWNATARLGRLHVRSFDSDAERSVLLVVDRAPRAGGPAGDTALDHLRTAALGVVAGARERNDPVGLVTIDDDGVETMRPPRATAETYEAVRRRLEGLEPATTSADGARPTARFDRRPGLVARKASVLADDDSAFARTLEPYFDAGSTPLHGRDRTLFEATGTALGRAGTPALVVLLSDDGARAGLRRAVDLGLHRGSEVVVFLAPAVRFDPDAGSESGSRRDRNDDFGRFRRELDAKDGVTAVEVGPGDRGGA